MKTKAFIACAFIFAFSGAAHAFNPLITIPMTNFSPGGIVVGAPQVLNVPGYGNVTFTAVGGNLSYLASPSSLRFQSGESLQISFDEFYTIEQLFVTSTGAPGESLNSSGALPGYDFSVVWASGSSAGLQSISFSPAPEPSSAMLGILGAALVVLRRRR